MVEGRHQESRFKTMCKMPAGGDEKDEEGSAAAGEESASQAGEDGAGRDEP